LILFDCYNSCFARFEYDLGVGGFKVEIDSLKGLQSGLRDTEGRLNQAAGTLKSGSAEQLGGKELDDACGDFSGEWHYGIGQVAKFARSIADRMDEAIKVYTETEEAIKAGMTPDGKPK
jgi:hypothetical protein